jgi:hypothetical protein
MIKILFHVLWNLSKYTYSSYIAGLSMGGGGSGYLVTRGVCVRYICVRPGCYIQLLRCAGRRFWRIWRALVERGDLLVGGGDLLVGGGDLRAEGGDVLVHGDEGELGARELLGGVLLDLFGEVLRDVLVGDGGRVGRRRGLVGRRGSLVGRGGTKAMEDAVLPVGPVALGEAVCLVRVFLAFFCVLAVGVLAVGVALPLAFGEIWDLHCEVALGHACCGVELGGWVLRRLVDYMAGWFASCGQRVWVLANVRGYIDCLEFGLRAFVLRTFVSTKKKTSKKKKEHANQGMAAESVAEILADVVYDENREELAQTIFEVAGFPLAGCPSWDELVEAGWRERAQDGGAQSDRRLDVRAHSEGVPGHDGHAAGRTA